MWGVLIGGRVGVPRRVDIWLVALAFEKGSLVRLGFRDGVEGELVAPSVG
jgi:hypothetical protein